MDINTEPHVGTTIIHLNLSHMAPLGVDWTLLALMEPLYARPDLKIA